MQLKKKKEKKNKEWKTPPRLQGCKHFITLIQNIVSLLTVVM